VSKIGNPVFIFPIKKKINTALFFVRTAALDIGQRQIRDKTTLKGCAYLAESTVRKLCLPNVLEWEIKWQLIILK